MNLQALILGAAIAVGPTVQEPVACELVDAASAEAVLGSDAVDFGGSAAPGVCRYDNADHSLVMMVQILPAGLYDVSPINPHTPVDIGDRGRYGVGASGTAHVQFAKGEFSVTLRVTPMHGPPATDLVDPLIAVARIAAERLPG